MNRTHQNRRGSVYLIVLGAAMIVAVLGMSGLLLLRVQRRNVESTIDTAKARHYAQTAIEMGLYHIENDDNWRSTNSNGVWINAQAIDDGAFTLEGIDPVDGNLTDDDTDTLVLTGIGASGNARQKIQTTLVPEIWGLDCLKSALHVHSIIGFNGATVQADQTISTNGFVWSASSTINANVEAGTSISGSTYNGTKTTGVEPRDRPASTAFDYYKTAGTWININLIPQNGSYRTIDEKLFSPANNPYGGATNSSGIYVINCGGEPLRIHDTRVVGTLVILNPGANSAIKDSIHWEPAVTNFPSLLVDGDFRFDFDAAPLDETAGGNPNFNPSGTPYEGVDDADSLDQYPSIIKGLVYVSDDIVVDGNTTFNGVIVCGSVLYSDGTLNITHQSTFYNDPPPGFTAPALMKVSTGSWQRSVD